MKFIPYRTFQGFDTRGIIFMVATKADHCGAKVEDIRRRIRIQDALDACEKAPGVSLEDADHEYLRGILAEFPFGFATKDLLQIIDDVNDAKAPPAIVNQPKGKKAA